MVWLRRSRPISTLRRATRESIMSIHETPRRAPWAGRRLSTALWAAVRIVSVGGVAACNSIADSLLSVELPTRVDASNLNNPQLAPLMAQSATADFECALVNYAAATGTFVDEFIGSTGWAAYTAWDTRRVFSDNFNLGQGTCIAFGWGVYQSLQTARFQAEDGSRRIQAFADADVPGKTSLLATLSAYAGYSYVLLGEGFCRVAIDLGPAMTPAQVFAVAEQRFTDAIALAQASGNTPMLNLALVGRARARLDLGKKPEAAADAALVPQGFTLNATYSGVTERRFNRIYVQNQREFYISVHPSFRNLTFGGVPDPRVPVTDAGRNGHDGVTRVWFEQKYKSDGDPIPIATWQEAQLIIAEVQGGQPAVDAINLIHTAAGLPAFSSSDPNEIAQQVLEERRRQFFLDGHRLGDMLRLGIPFETGTTLLGIPYASTTCLPLPDAEAKNNPNI